LKRCKLDKIASVTLRLHLDRNAVLGEDIPACAGTVIAARVLNAKTAYNTLEDVHGRQVPLHPGDVIAGALLSRTDESTQECRQDKTQLSSFQKLTRPWRPLRGDGPIKPCQNTA